MSDSGSRPISRGGKDVAMLVIISDLHLTDGSNGSSTPAGAFHLFAERLQALAVAAGYRSDGSYRPVESLDLVLLGDVLDCLRTSKWLAGETRPWSDPHSSDFFNAVARITGEILSNNEEALSILRGLARGELIHVPPAMARQQPDLAAAPRPTPVRIHYMVGNHDWFYHLPGPHYDRLRESLVQHLGLANRADRPFPHDPAESAPLLEMLRRHKVLARHGDIFDPFNFEQDRNASSLGDCIVIELIGRFAIEVERDLGDDLPHATRLGLAELDNIRPSLLAPVWIDGLLERTCPVPVIRKRVKLVWDRLVDRFLALEFVRSRDSWSPVDLVDGLERVLKFSKRLSVGWASSIVNWLHSVRGPGEPSYVRHALAEQDFRNRRARHIVYGHTHLAESIPLDASYAEGYVLNQMYFNAGTWRRVFRPTSLAPCEHEFIPAECLTYLAFYQADERKGRPYETWSGTLGLVPPSGRTYRLDAQHARQPVQPHLRVPSPSGLPLIIPTLVPNEPLA